MKRRLIRNLPKGMMTVATIVVVACIDMSAPKGPASISVLLLPSPSVVVGDTMRDSNGVAAPITLVAYNASGSPISGLTTQFFFTDSVRVAHLSSSGELVGDTLGVAHIVGQIGGVQTDVTPVTVTAAPDSLTMSVAPDTLVAPVGVDSASSLGTEPLGVTLRSAAQLPVAGFVVRYVLLYAPAPASAGGSPAVFINGDAGKISLVDTTDASGTASRTLTVNARQLSDTLDSAVVKASATYKGLPVKNSPVTFVVPIKVVIP